MAEREHKGLVARWLEGKERSDDYVRTTLPTNRWSLFWDILKGRFGRLMLVNFLVLLTFLPIVAVYVFRYISVSVSDLIGPYGSGLMVGYPVIPGAALTGVAQMQTVETDIVFFSLFIVASLIAVVGISGGMYIVRNLIWTEGIFVANDFLHGIKRNFWNVLEAVLFFTLVLFITQTMINLADYSIAVMPSMRTLMIISKAVSYVVLVLALLMSMWMVSLGVNYQQGPFALLRNAFIMTIATLPQTILFAALALIPFLLALFTSGLLMALGVVILLLFGFSWALLVWMDYSQWAFDKFVNPNIGVATGRGLYNKDGKQEEHVGGSATMRDSEAMREYRRQIVAQGRSKLMCRPIQPIDDGTDIYQLPESFSREDLQKLRDSRNKMDEEVKAYEEEHKNDEQYVEYNRQFDERERALEEENGGKKKKQKRPPKMLNKRK